MLIMAGFSYQKPYFISTYTVWLPCLKWIQEQAFATIFLSFLSVRSSEFDTVRLYEFEVLQNERQGALIIIIINFWLYYQR
jgi:hypothetical protein